MSNWKKTLENIIVDLDKFHNVEFNTELHNIQCLVDVLHNNNMYIDNPDFVTKQLCENLYLGFKIYEKDKVKR